MDPTTIEEEIKTGKPRNILMILGIILLLLGLAAITSGTLVFVYNQNLDSEGFAYSDVYHVNTSAYAFTLYMNPYKTSIWGFLGSENVAQMKFIVKSTNHSKELFTGFVTTTAGEQYRQSFQSEFPTNWRYRAKPYHAAIIINTTHVEGHSAPPSLPQTQTFWLTTAQSNRTADMTYLPLDEQHMWFIMNQDGSKNVQADIQIAFKSPILMVLPYILLPLGAIFVAIGIYCIRRKKITQ